MLTTLAIMLAGIALDAGDGTLGSAFTVSFFLGCLVAVLFVARRSVFLAGAQPPVLLTVVVPLVYMAAGSGGGTSFFSRTQIISAVLPLLERFPLMLVTTLVVVVIALLRAFVLQPGPLGRR